jgi:hypothetical protein
MLDLAYFEAEMSVYHYTLHIIALPKGKCSNANPVLPLRYKAACQHDWSFNGTSI